MPLLNLLGYLPRPDVVLQRILTYLSSKQYR